MFRRWTWTYWGTQSISGVTNRVHRSSRSLRKPHSIEARSGLSQLLCREIDPGVAGGVMTTSSDPDKASRLKTERCDDPIMASRAQSLADDRVGSE